MKKILLIFAFAVGFGIGSLAQATPVPLYEVVNSSKAYTGTSAIADDLNDAFDNAYYLTGYNEFDVNRTIVTEQSVATSGILWLTGSSLTALVGLGRRCLGELT